MTIRDTAGIFDHEVALILKANGSYHQKDTRSWVNHEIDFLDLRGFLQILYYIEEK